MAKLGALLAIDVMLNNSSRIRVDDMGNDTDGQPNFMSKAQGSGFQSVFGTVSGGGIMASSTLILTHAEMRPLPDLRAVEKYCKLVEKFCVELSASIKQGKEPVRHMLDVAERILACTGVNIGLSGVRLLEEGFASGARAIVGQEDHWLSWRPQMPSPDGGGGAPTAVEDSEDEDIEWADGGFASREIVVVERVLALYRSSFGSQFVR